MEGGSLWGTYDEGEQELTRTQTPKTKTQREGEKPNPNPNFGACNLTPTRNQATSFKDAVRDWRGDQMPLTKRSQGGSKGGFSAKGATPNIDSNQRQRSQP